MIKLDKLSVDIETFSEVDLKKQGLYKYAAHRSFEILLFSFKDNDLPTVRIDLAAGQKIPKAIIAKLYDPNVIKTAWNAAFEIRCISEHLMRLGMPALKTNQWHCTMVKATMLGYPPSLQFAALAVGVGKKKLETGKNLIKVFCVPRKPTKKDPRTRIYWNDEPELWEEFGQYCERDVDVEYEIYVKLEWFVIPNVERNIWVLDQMINARGIKIDRELVDNVIDLSDTHSRVRKDEASDITGLSNPNSVAQLKAWLGDELGMPIPSLNKDAVKELIGVTDASDVIQLLKIRQELSKSSVKKFHKMRLTMDDKDDSVRGLFQYYGANRTGRWAGRFVQVQNLRRNKLKDLKTARECAKQAGYDFFADMYDQVSDTISQLCRTAFIARNGSRFVISDFSAIEARVIAWLAGESWRLEVFKTHGKIYEASASQMFGIPLEQIDSDLRTKGKIAELALGYQGAVDALIKMGALDMGLSEDELLPIVKAWRKANRKICSLWYDVNNAAIHTVRTGETTHVSKVKFAMHRGFLVCILPSGRKLYYPNARLVESEYGNESIQYKGTDEKGKWTTIRTYGGKLVENIVQAISRDILAHAMMKVTKRGYIIVMHVHDEIVAEMPIGQGNIKEMNALLAEPIPWANGLPLAAAGFESEYYKKDD